MPTQDTLDRVRGVFEAQRSRRWDVAATTVEQRIEKLKALKRAVVQRREALAAAVYADFRKSVAEFELTEVHPVIEEINHAIENLADWMDVERVKTPLVLLGTKSAIRHEPLGVVLIVAPWNYPFNLLFLPLVPAIAAGNCVVLKPSPKTAHFAEEARELVGSVFREDEVALLTGGVEVADALLELPFDHIFFTGSTQVGRKVMGAAARHLATVTLELGGKSPVVIDRSADIDQTALRVMWGKCLNAGQTCVAPDYALAEAPVVAAFAAAAEQVVGKFYGESEEAREQSPDLPRLIDDAAWQRVKGLVERSVALGARVAFGARFDAATRYVAPTLLTEVTADMPIMQEEIFGPVLPVVTVKGVPDACAFVRSREKPLALYVFAQDRDVIEQVLSTTTSGGAVVNDTVLHLANAHLPFGGVGASGQGSYHGVHGFLTFSHARAVLDHHIHMALPLFYPPYEKHRSVLAQSMLKYLE